MPGGQADELARGDHAGRGERQALTEDLRVRTPLRDQVGDQVVVLAATVRADGGADVGQVDAEPVGVLPHQPVQAPRAGQSRLPELLGEEPLQPAADAGPAVPQSDDLAHHADGQLEGQVGERCPARRPQHVQLFLGDADHQVAVVLVHAARSEEARGLPPVLPVLGAVPVEHRPAYARRQLLHRLDAETGLYGAGGAQQRTRDLVIVHLPRPVRRAADRARRPRPSPVGLARGARRPLSAVHHDTPLPGVRPRAVPVTARPGRRPHRISPAPARDHPSNPPSRALSRSGGAG